MNELIIIGLKFGIIQSLAMWALFSGAFVYNSEVWVGDYPPDIREAYGEITPKSKRDKKLVGIPLILFSLGFPILMLTNINVGDYSFGELVLGLFIMLQVFNLFDLLIIDWLIMCAITPRYLILKGTEGLRGYKDYWFHFKGFLIGTGIITLVSLSLAGITFWIN